MLKGPNSVYEIDTEILKILLPVSDEEKYELFHHLFSRYCEVITLPKFWSDHTDKLPKERRI